MPDITLPTTEHEKDLVLWVASECGRIPTSFEELETLKTIGAFHPDSPLWFYTADAEEDGLEVWQEITDFDVARDGSKWWAWNTAYPMDAIVYVQEKDLIVIN